MRFITDQYEPDLVAYNEGRVGDEQETTSMGIGSSILGHILLAPPSSIDHVVGVIANLVQLPS